MRQFFTSLLFILLCSSASAQQWMELEQTTLHLRYKIPKGWYVGGYKSVQKCQCTGAAVNTSKTGAINMVIFYSNQQSIDSLGRQSVWGYTFDMSRVQTSRGVETTHFNFSQQLSVWKEDPSLTVLRLKAQMQEHCYLIYFWGTPADLEAYSDDIQHIVQSLQVYNP